MGTSRLTVVSSISWWWGWGWCRLSQCWMYQFFQTHLLLEQQQPEQALHVLQRLARIFPDSSHVIVSSRGIMPRLAMNHEKKFESNFTNNYSWSLQGIESLRQVEFNGWDTPFVFHTHPQASPHPLHVQELVCIEFTIASWFCSPSPSFCGFIVFIPRLMETKPAQLKQHPLIVLLGIKGKLIHSISPPFSLKAHTAIAHCNMRNFKESEANFQVLRRIDPYRLENLERWVRMSRHSPLFDGV